MNVTVHLIPWVCWGLLPFLGWILTAFLIMRRDSGDWDMMTPFLFMLNVPAWVIVALAVALVMK